MVNKNNHYITTVFLDKRIMKAALDQAIRLLNNGDQRGMDYIFQAYHKKIYFFVIKLGMSNAIAEELVQDVFVKVWNSKQYIKESGNIQSYIYTIAKNVVIDEYKRQVKRKAAEDYQIHLMNPSNDTERRVEYNELKSTIGKILEKLPEKRRMVFEMSRFEGKKNREIAEEMGISIKTVETHLTLALQTFKSSLKNVEAVNLSLFILLTTVEVLA